MPLKIAAFAVPHLEDPASCNRILPRVVQFATSGYSISNGGDSLTPDSAWCKPPLAVRNKFANALGGFADAEMTNATGACGGGGTDFEFIAGLTLNPPVVAFHPAGDEVVPVCRLNTRGSRLSTSTAFNYSSSPSRPSLFSAFPRCFVWYWPLRF